jgi:hypothetical protein
MKMGERKDIWLSANTAMFDMLEPTKSLEITSQNKNLMVPCI